VKAVIGILVVPTITGADVGEWPPDWCEASLQFGILPRGGYLYTAYGWPACYEA